MDQEKKKEKHVDPKLHKAAQELGSKGGKKGGPSRAAKLTPEQRSHIARLGGLSHSAKKGVKGSKEIEGKNKHERGEDKK